MIYQNPAINPVSVDEAIAKGRQMLLIPRILMILGMFLFLFIAALIIMGANAAESVPAKVWVIIGAVLFGSFAVFVFLPFLYLSNVTTRWKLWAFEQVHDFDELKILASQANLYAVYGSGMDKIMIQSAGNRERWKQLQSRENSGVFIDDYSVPAETQIFYSKPILVFYIIITSVLVLAGFSMIYFGFTEDPSLGMKILGTVLSLSFLFMGSRFLKSLRDPNPQLIIGNKGLFTKATGLIPWDQLYQEEVKRVQQGKAVRYVLYFNHPGGNTNIDITQFAGSRYKLQRLMRLYRKRFDHGIF